MLWTILLLVAYPWFHSAIFTALALPPKDDVVLTYLVGVVACYTIIAIFGGFFLFLYGLGVLFA